MVSITQAGFVRISSNPRIFHAAPTPAKALEILKLNLAHSSHHFWKDDLPFAQAAEPIGGRFSGHQQTTDVYLLGLAIRKQGILATFDAAIASLLSDDSPHTNSLEILKA